MLFIKDGEICNSIDIFGNVSIMMIKRECESFWNVNVKCLIIKEVSINFRWWDEKGVIIFYFCN